ncbi:MAG: hypothetical protein ACREEQ_04850, partial [Caulobacteraceae bacterium]
MALARAGAEVGLWAADGSATTTPLVAGTEGLRLLGGRFEDAFASFDPDMTHDNGVWLPHNHRIAALARMRGWPRLVSARGMLEPWALAHKRWKKEAAWRLYQRRDVEAASA